MIEEVPDQPTKQIRQKPEPSFFAMAKQRLRQAIERVLAKGNVDFMILVLDDAAQSLVNALFSSIELSLLNINIVHNLGKASRPRKYDALYIIEGNERSVEEVCKDFSDARSQKYLDAHVLVLNSLKDKHFDRIKREKNLLQHLRTLDQIDIGFVPYLENAFDLGMKGYFDRSKSGQWLEETVERLGTAILSYHPFNEMSIVYSPKHEQTAKQLSKYIVKRIAVLTSGNIKNCESKTPKIRVLLLDRELDLQSPMMRDYNYLPLVFDVFDVRKNLLPIEKEEKYCLRPELDKVWEQIKFKNLIEASNALSTMAIDVKSFAQQKAEKMNEQLAKLQEKVNAVQQLKTHQNLLHEINTKHGPELSLLTALEQTIVNGVDEVGQKLKDKDIYRKVCQFFKVGQKLSEINYLRVVSLCLFSLELKENQVSSLMECVKVPELKELPKKVLRISPKPKKLNEVLQSEDIQLLFRHQSEIVRYTSMFLRNALQHFAEEVVPIEQSRGRGLKTVTINPKLFVFVDGYLGFNEILEISRLQSLQDERIICGSHLLTTPRAYLEEIVQLDAQK